MGNNTDGDGRSKESKERQLHLRSTHLGKGKCTHEISQTNADRSEQEMGDGNRILKPQVLKGTSESLDHRGNQKSMEASTCSAGSILEENDASDRRRALKEVDTAKDVISKRKQQREAVDALLSSALIPSKKSAASLKAAPAKRSLSPALNAGCDINLPKPRKGELLSLLLSLTIEKPFSSEENTMLCKVVFLLLWLNVLVGSSMVILQTGFVYGIIYLVLGAFYVQVLNLIALFRSSFFLP